MVVRKTERGREGGEGYDGGGDDDADGKKRKKKREDHELDHNGKEEGEEEEEEEGEEGKGGAEAPVLSWRKHPYKPLDKLTLFEKQIYDTNKNECSPHSSIVIPTEMKFLLMKNKPLDLERLYKAVDDKGGFEYLEEKGLWEDVYEAIADEHKITGGVKFIQEAYRKYFLALLDL